MQVILIIICSRIFGMVLYRMTLKRWYLGRGLCFLVIKLPYFFRGFVLKYKNKRIKYKQLLEVVGQDLQVTLKGGGGLFF